MSQIRSCCVPGCSVTKNTDITLHRFPDPVSRTTHFKIWLDKVGGEITGMDFKNIYDNKRICRKHFEEIYKYPKNRLSNLAIPTLLMTEQSKESLTVTSVTLPSSSHFNPFYSDITSGLQADLEINKIPINKKRQQEKKGRKFKVSFQEHRKYNKILKKLRKCEVNTKMYKRKLALAKSLTKTTAFQIISKNMSPTAKLFCQMQASQSTKQKRGRRFTLDEKILALSLYKPAPKAYRLLSKFCILPSRQTLLILLQKINLKAGINNQIFDNLRARVARMPEKFKYCTLVFDEMAIAPGITYNKKDDVITGFVDNGDTITKEYSDHVLVFLIRGIVKKFKQPLAYYFCRGSTKAVELKALIKNIIIKIEETGLKVVATTCDQGASNVSAINSLLNETKELYLRREQQYTEGFFEINKKKVFPLYDPPHLIKGIRNNLLTKNLKYVMNGKQCIAKWSHVMALYNRCPGYNGVRMAPKLTAYHIVPSLIPKMRVKYCTQVFSKTVGAAIGIMAGFGAIEKDSTNTADLFMFFDELFDSVNGNFSQPKGGKIYRTAVTPTSVHHKLWNTSLPILKTMKFVDANNQGVVPSLSSWIKTIENFKRISCHLNTKGIDSLLLRNFNQDALENFFGAIRVHGCSSTMPTAQAFKGAFKTLLINNLSSLHSVGSNCEKDDSFCLQTLKKLLLKNDDKGAETPTACEVEIEDAHLFLQLVNTDELIKSVTPMHIEKTAAIGYCSGWIAQQAKKKIYRTCMLCKKDMESDEMQPFHTYIKLKEYENKDWLCYPTRNLFDFVANVESICIQTLKESCNKKHILNYIKLIVNIHLNLTFLQCSQHNQLLKEYLINKCAIFFTHNWCKEINNLLSGKATFWDINDEMKVKAQRHYSKNKGRKRRKLDGSLINV